MRYTIVMLTAVVVTGAAAVIFFPQSSQTSAGMTSIKTRGIPESFAASVPMKLRRLGRPHVLANRNGKAFIRVTRSSAGSQQAHESSCWGLGTFARGKVAVSLLDCTPFPSAARPVLDEIGEEVVDRAKHRTSVLFIEGFAADGVAELRLVDSSGQITARAKVDDNVFDFAGVAGRDSRDATLVAVDAQGRGVWKRVL